MRIADDAPSRDILETRLASLCVHDPDGKHVNKACTLVRVYTGQPHRNYEQELELQGANRWVEAPLVVPGTNEVIGKIVVDNGVHSDVLNVRDALDVGFLAMMAAGAIYAFQMAEERRALIRNAELLNEIYSFLPRVVLERNDQRFYRVIAALLSCDPGLQWEQVLLFIADSTGLMQAECAMALGGIDPSVRERIKRACTRLRDYVDLALNEVRGPQGDALFERWVEFGSEEQRINFGSDVQDRGAIAEALGRPTELPWREIDVTEDPWCRKLNADDQFFLGKRVFAFPLTRSFAVDSAIDTQSTPTQPVGVAVVGMITEGREVEEQRLVFTRVVLDLFGPLIAQRWTNQRMSGLYGSLYRINHADLVSTWNAMPSVRQNIEVLVVDNRRDHLEEWCSALRVIPDCHVRTAESFEDAVDQLQEEAVDLLITDLFLTRESEVRERLAEAEGLDLIEQCRLRYPDSRIIAITSLVGNGDAGAEAMVRGADDFISSQWLDVYAKALLEQKAKIFRSLLLRDRRKGNTANVK
jgi:ActR/RegA family two-component response regulator